MQIKNLLIIGALGTSMAVSAEVLTPEQALSRIERNNISTRGELSPTLDYLIEDVNGTPAVYLFNLPDSGFMIVSADDCAVPLLGYSKEGKLDVKNLPSEFKFWIEEYGKQIGHLRSEGAEKYLASSDGELEEMTAVGPLLKTKWNQGTPYNKYCYTISADGSRTQSVTGCVATAMAQVMNYFQYPEIGKGEISYSHEGSGVYSMNFGEQPFDWNQMKDTYYPDTYTEEEGDAVAYLMKACGYAVKMDYGKGESGADGASIPDGLINYFSYADDIVIATRKFWTYNQWAQMIYDNLTKVGPVVYDGSAIDGGHSFVCDGYDGNGYFHFNWGWGGMADGYYLLDALNPDEYGIGGVAGGYNLGQQAILGISPKPLEKSEYKLMQTGNVSGEIVEGDELKLSLSGNNPGFQYINPEIIDITFGIMVVDVDDEETPIQYFESEKKEQECRQGEFFRWEDVGLTLNLDKVEMIEGANYDFIIATLIKSSSGSYWSEVKAYPGNYNYISITKNSKGYEIKNYSPENISVSDFEIMTTPIYQNLPVKFRATFTNGSSTQLTRNYSAVLLDSKGEKCFTMENFGITVAARRSQSVEWTSAQWFKDEKASEIIEETAFTLRLYDNWEGSYVEGIEMILNVLPEPKDTKVDASLSLPGYTPEDDLYILTKSQFEVSIEIKVEAGYFSRPVNLDIEVPTSDGGYYSVESKRFDTIPSLSVGEEQTITLIMEFPDAVEGQEYRLQAWSNGETLGEFLRVKFELDGAGIKGIMPDANGNYKVFTLNGIEILNTKKTDELGGLTKGFYIINGKKIKI